MKVRIALAALVAVSILGACGEEGQNREGGVVEPAATSSSTAPTTVTTTAPSSVPSTTATTAKATTTTTAVPSTTSTTARATTTTTRPAATTTTGASITYANCDAVRAAGKAPLHRGDPGYSSKLDRDSDGIACE